MVAPPCGRHIKAACLGIIVDDAARIRAGLTRAIADTGYFLTGDRPLPDLLSESETLLLTSHGRNPDWHTFLPQWPPSDQSSIYDFPSSESPCLRHNLRCFKRFYVMVFAHWQGYHDYPSDGVDWPGRVQEYIWQLTCLPEEAWYGDCCPWPIPSTITELQAQGLFYLVNLATGLLLACLTGHAHARQFFLTKFAEGAPRVFVLLRSGEDPARPPPPYSIQDSPPPPYGSGMGEGVNGQ